MRSSTVLPWAMIIFLWLLISAVGFAQQGHMLLGGYALGPDSYVRLTRVEDLLVTLDWYQTRIVDLGYPVGADIHWTRPLDILILLMAAPLMMFMTSAKAIFWAGASISAVSTLAATVAFVWAIRPMLKNTMSKDAPGDIWLLPAAALLAQPVIIGYGLIGRADHHMTLVLLFVVTVGFLLRAMADTGKTRDALFCGVAIGAGLWMSVELLVALLPVTAAFALVWMRRTGSAAQGLSFSIGLVVMVAIAVLLENPPSSLWAPAYDRISVVHLTLAAGMFAFWWAVSGRDSRLTLGQRVAGLSLAAVLGGALMQGLFPGFYSGPLAELDALASTAWAANVGEMRSLFPTSFHAASELIMILGNGLFAIPFCIWMMRRAAGDGPRNLWLACALLLAVSVPMAVLHVRFALYAEVILLVIIAAAWARAQAGKSGILRRDGSIRVALLRTAAVAAILMGATAIGGGLIVIQNKGARADAARLVAGAAGCDLKETGAYLDGVSATPLTVLTHVDHGPALVYHSHQRVLAGPYHRDGAAIIGNRDLLAGSDLGALRASFRGRGIDMVLLCGTDSEAGFFAEDPVDDALVTLFEALIADNPPPWLHAVELPDNAGSGARAFAFSNAALAALDARE